MVYVSSVTFGACWQWQCGGRKIGGQIVPRNVDVGVVVEIPVDASSQRTERRCLDYRLVVGRRYGKSFFVACFCVQDGC